MGHYILPKGIPGTKKTVLACGLDESSPLDVLRNGELPECAEDVRDRGESSGVHGFQAGLEVW